MLTYARREFTSMAKFHCRSGEHRPQCTSCTRRETNWRRRARCTPRALDFQSRPSCKSQAEALRHTERWRKIIRSRQNFQWRHYLKRNILIRDLNGARADHRNVTEHGEESKVEGKHVSVCFSMSHRQKMNAEDRKSHLRRASECMCRGENRELERVRQ